jgi:hypothetical protein
MFYIQPRFVHCGERGFVIAVWKKDDTSIGEPSNAVGILDP